MPGPNGKILAKGSNWYADLDNHASEFADDAVVEFCFQCSWCAFQISVTTHTVEEAAEEAVLRRNWRVAEDDDQVGLCCPSCLDKS